MLHVISISLIGPRNERVVHFVDTKTWRTLCGLRARLHIDMGTNVDAALRSEHCCRRCTLIYRKDHPDKGR